MFRERTDTCAGHAGDPEAEGPRGNYDGWSAVGAVRCPRCKEACALPVAAVLACVHVSRFRCCVSLLNGLFVAAQLTKRFSEFTGKPAVEKHGQMPVHAFLTDYVRARATCVCNYGCRLYGHASVCLLSCCVPCMQGKKLALTAYRNAVERGKIPSDAAIESKAAEIGPLRPAQ